MQYNRAKTGEIFRYGFGGVGSNIPFILTMQYLMFFLTDHAGISAAAVGGLFMVTRIIDAITDPLMGMIADRTRSVYGKYRPYILFGSPLLGISVVLLFWFPSLGVLGKTIYIYIAYICYSLLSTMVNIPYHSLTPLLSQDPDQRTTIATFKQVLGIVGTLFVAAGAIPITTALGGGARAWTLYAAICGVLTIGSFYICAHGAKRADKPLPATSAQQTNSHMSLKKQLSLITKNRALLMLMIAFGTDMIAFAAAQAVNIYYFTYAVKRPDLIMSIALIGTCISVGVSLFIPALSKVIGKKRLFITGSIVMMLLSATLYFVPFSNTSAIFALSLATSGFGVLTGVVGWAMLADCVDYGEWKTGYRGAGTVSSQLTFVNKLGMALGGFLAGALLQAANYVPNQAQTQETLQTILNIKTILPVLGYIASLIAMAFYPINNAFYGKILEENEKRRTQGK